MRNQTALVRTLSALVAATLAGCAGSGRTQAPDRPASFTWPAQLAAFGGGCPTPGDACRRVGESPDTSAYLDHTATLVGCPGERDGAAVQAVVRARHGRVVGERHGVTLISVPNERDGAGARE